MMEETIRLYDGDAYAAEFTACVLSCGKTDENTYQVVLDRTLFFPEEGGQSPDCGNLGEAEVTDVQIKQGIITHTTDKPLEAGKTVTGKIDWQHRFSNMQQHSAEHIFSGVVNRRFGFQNVGFHLSNQIVTMDYNGVLTPEDVEAVEWEVNEAIVKNVEIQVSFPAKEELKRLEYRSKIEIEGQVRIVTIPGFDVCACCAPHVKRTGEIGGFKVMGVQNYKGGVRISMLAGFRALQAYREKAAVLSELGVLLSAAQEMLPEQVDKLKKANQSLKSQLAGARQELMEYKISSISEEEKDVFLFEKDLEPGVVRNVVNRLAEEHEGSCGVFTGSEKEGYRYIIGSKHKDCKELAVLLKERLNARGGGSPAMIQGSLEAKKEEILTVLGEA